MSDPAPKILVVDDEYAIRRALGVTLGNLGFSVVEAASGEEALILALKEPFDAVLLDMNMPGMEGTIACRELRRVAPKLAIIMLTVRDSSEDKIAALDSGADDYVTKPFHMRELTARLRAAVRRGGRGADAPDESIRIAEIVLDQSRRMVFKQGRRIHLTPKEFDLLQILMANGGRPVAHSKLLSAVWGQEYSGQLEYLRTFIHQLRKKLEDDPAHPVYVMTESWYGYRFRQ